MIKFSHKIVGSLALAGLLELFTNHIGMPAPAVAAVGFSAFMAAAFLIPSK